MTNTTVATQTATQTATKKAITSFEHVGIELANQLARQEGDLFMNRKTALKLAFEKIQGEVQAKQFLNGFSDQLKANGSTTGSADSRKSEVKSLWMFYKQATPAMIEQVETEATGYHQLVKAARDFSTILISPEAKEVAEAKKATQEANRATKRALEAEAKATAPITSEELQEIIATLNRLDALQINVLAGELSELKKVKIAQEKQAHIEKKALARQEAQIKEAALLKTLEDAQNALNALKMVA